MNGFKENCKEKLQDLKQMSAEHWNTAQFKSRTMYRKVKNSKKLKMILVAVTAGVLILITVIVMTVVLLRKPSGSNSSTNSDSPNAQPRVPKTTIPLDTTSVNPPPSNGEMAQIYTKCLDPGHISLTFDDGPSPNLPEVLKVLDEFQIKATFFVNAKYVSDFTVKNSPAYMSLQDLYKKGHQIGGHTLSHSDLTNITRQQRWTQMSANDQFILAALGVKPVHFRSPYMAYSNDMQLDLGSWGYVISGVGLNTMDDTFSTANVVNGVSQIVDPIINNADSKKDSYIVMMHEFKVGISDYLRKFIPQAQGKGFKFVTSEECLGYAAYRE